MDKVWVFAKLGIQRRVEDPSCKLNRAANYVVGFDNQVRSSGRVSQKLKYSKSHSTMSLSGFSKQLQLSVYKYVYRTYHQYFWFCRSWYWWWLGLYQLQYPFHWWLEIWPISVLLLFVCLFGVGLFVFFVKVVSRLETGRSFFVTIDLRFRDRVTHSLFLSSQFLKSRHTLPSLKVTHVAQITRG